MQLIFVDFIASNFVELIFLIGLCVFVHLYVYIIFRVFHLKDYLMWNKIIFFLLPQFGFFYCFFLPNFSG